MIQSSDIVKVVAKIAGATARKRAVRFRLPPFIVKFDKIKVQRADQQLHSLVCSI